jgi:hypothetical protein
MSPQTLALRHGLDPEKEQRLIRDLPGGEGEMARASAG